MLQKKDFDHSARSRAQSRCNNHSDGLGADKHTLATQTGQHEHFQVTEDHLLCNQAA